MSEISTDVRDGRRFAYGNALLAGVFFVLATYTEMTFAVFLLLFAVIVVLAKAPLRSPRRLFLGGRPLVVAGAVSLAGLAPLLFLVWRESGQEGSFLGAGWGYADAFSADLLGFFLPTTLHPLLGKLATSLTAGFTDPNIVFLGYATLALSLLGAIVFWSRLRLWVSAALVFLILCLGPLLHVNGVANFDFDGLQANLPLPFILLHYLPLVKANRMPNRFVVMVVLCLAVLAGFGLYWLLSWLARRASSGGLTALPAFAGVAVLTAVLFEHLAIPLPLNEMRVPTVYQMIAQEPGDFAILQLPLGWRNSYGVLGSERTIIQSYQAVHHKRMLGGNTSRNPDFKFGYFSRLPVLKTIIALEQDGKVDATPTPADGEMAQRLAALYDLRYVVVHRQYVAPQVESYAVQVFGLEKVAEDGDVVAYRVPRQALGDKLTIDLGQPESWANQGEGWSDDEKIAGETTVNWVTKSTARLFFPAEGAKDLVARLRILPFIYQGMPAQVLTVTVNGHEVGRFSLAGEWREYAVDIPASALRQGLNEMDLHFAHLASPSAVLPGDYRIGMTGVESPVGITVRSAGMNAGNAAEIEIAGQSVAKGRRGYNIVVLNPVTGKVEHSEAFDTFASEAEAGRLQRFIAGLPAGRIVIGAVKDEGSRTLTAEAVAALQTVGVKSDLRGKNRWSQAFIGVKGAGEGQALEAMSENSVSLSIGPNPDNRDLAAAVDYVELETK